MSPTLVTSYQVLSAAADNTTLTTPSFTPSNGEVIVVKAATWSTTDGMSTPTGGSQTYSPVIIAAPGGFNCWAGLWVATVSGSPGSMTVSCAPATGSNTRHSMVVERWSHAAVAGTPATNDITSSSGTTASATVVSTAANSIISWALADVNAQDPANTTYITTSGTPTQDGIYNGHSGTQSVQYFAYQPAATTGNQTVGMTNTASLGWVMVAVEILDNAGVQTITPTGIVSGTAFGVPKLSFTLYPVGIFDEAFGRPTLTGGLQPSSQHLEIQAELNRLAGTTGLGEAGAANAWAGTTGLETVGALNHKAGLTSPLTWMDLAGVCNYIAGTSGLEPPGALATIPTGS